MGLFNKTSCPICNKEVGVLDKSFYKYNSEYICGDCLSSILKSGHIINYKDMELPELKQLIKEAPKIKTYSLKSTSDYDISVGRYTISPSIKRVGGYLEINTANKTWSIPGIFGGTGMIPYSAILDYELLEDGTSVTKGGASIGRAIVGGAVFGPVGLIIGGVTGKRKQKNFCTTMQIKITLNSISSPTRYIKFITSKTKKSGATYKTACKNAQEVLSLLNVITSDQTNTTNVNPVSPSNSSADEIKKYWILAQLQKMNLKLKRNSFLIFNYKIILKSSYLSVKASSIVLFVFLRYFLTR